MSTKNASRYMKRFLSTFAKKNYHTLRPQKKPVAVTAKRCYFYKKTKVASQKVS